VSAVYTGNIIEHRMLTVFRLDGLVPNTPGAAKLNRSSAPKRKFETPSVSRVKGGVPSSSPDVKTPNTVDRQLDSLNSLT
jgi:DNA polymerase alpha subunit B